MVLGYGVLARYECVLVSTAAAVPRLPESASEPLEPRTSRRFKTFHVREVLFERLGLGWENTRTRRIGCDVGGASEGWQSELLPEWRRAAAKMNATRPGRPESNSKTTPREPMLLDQSSDIRLMSRSSGSNDSDMPRSMASRSMRTHGS
jgi:hypothetical protein